MLWKDLQNNGIPEHLICVLQSLLYDILTGIKLGKRTSKKCEKPHEKSEKVIRSHLCCLTCILAISLVIAKCFKIVVHNQWLLSHFMNQVGSEQYMLLSPLLECKPIKLPLIVKFRMKRRRGYCRNLAVYANLHACMVCVVELLLMEY